MNQEENLENQVLLQLPEVLRAEVLESRALHEEFRATVAAFGDAELRRVYDSFDRFNRVHFWDRLLPPFIFVGMVGPKAEATYTKRDENGIRGRITIPRRTIAKGPSYLDETLLHEMIHMYVDQVDSKDESSLNGHGTRFCYHANRIGPEYGYRRISPRGIGPDSPGQWPHPYANNDEVAQNDLNDGEVVIETPSNGGDDQDVIELAPPLVSSPSTESEADREIRVASAYHLPSFEHLGASTMRHLLRAMFRLYRAAKRRGEAL